MKSMFSYRCKFGGKEVVNWDFECEVEDFKRCWKESKWYNKFEWVDFCFVDNKDRIVEEYVFYKNKGWKKIS